MTQKTSNIIQKTRLHLVFAVSLLTLAACGGGGGGNDPRANSGWQEAELIETDNAGSANRPKIAIDANGNAIAVWQQSDGTRYNIWANRYTASSDSWGTAQLIETDDAGSAYDPQIAMDPNGNAIAVWYQSDGTRYNIWANRYTASSDSWGTAQLIETDNAADAYGPQIAFDAGGNAIAVWSQNDGTRDNIWANRYTPDTGWGTAELIETDNAGDARNPQIAFDANGNAIAVWRQNDGTRYNIWANRYTASTDSWGTAELIETDNAGYAYYPQIAIDASGNAIAVWQQSDGTRYNIWANRYTASTDSWGTAQLIETDNAGDARYPQIAIDANGNAIAVWQQNDGTRYNIWANRYTASTDSWGTAELIETDDAGDAYYPQIAIDANGNAIAVWQQSDGSHDKIWTNRYTLGSGWGTTQSIGSSPTDRSIFAEGTRPAIAIDSNGDAITVWDQLDINNSMVDIWANRWLAP